MADACSNIRAHKLIKFAQRDAGGQNALDQLAGKQCLVILIGHTEVFGLALHAYSAERCHHFSDQADGALARTLALDLDQERRIRILCACVADALHICILSGRKRQIQIQRFTDHVDTGERSPALLKGLTPPADARLNALVRKQLVFDHTVALLQLLARLNIAGKEGTLVAELDRAALCSGLHGSLAGTRLLLGLNTLALQASCLLLGGKKIFVQDLIGTQGNLDRLAHTPLILGKLFTVVHQTGNRYGLFVFRVINHIIVKLLLVDVTVKLRQDLLHLPFCKQLYLITDNTVIELGVLQGKQAVHIADVIIGGHLRLLLT